MIEREFQIAERRVRHDVGERAVPARDYNQSIDLTTFGELRCSYLVIDQISTGVGVSYRTERARRVSRIDALRA